jgi:hypothetical protein
MSHSSDPPAGALLTLPRSVVDSASAIPPGTVVEAIRELQLDLGTAINHFLENIATTEGPTVFDLDDDAADDTPRECGVPHQRMCSPDALRLA